MSAIAALKGYRTQFLYSLHRIVLGVTDDYVYHIEGEFEDLDIIDNNGKYVECLQVKNLSDSLTFHFLLIRDSVVVPIDSLWRVSCKFCDLEWMKTFVYHLGDITTASSSPSNS